MKTSTVMVNNLWLHERELNREFHNAHPSNVFSCNSVEL